MIEKIFIPEAVVGLAKEAYYSGLDFRQMAMDSLNFAKEFLDRGDIETANKYIKKSARYLNFSSQHREMSHEIYFKALDIAQYNVIAKAAGIPIAFAGPGGVVVATLLEVEKLRSDYIVDKALEGPEKAKAKLFTNAFSVAVAKFSGVGKAAKKVWGSSRVYPTLEKLMGSSEFKKEVLESFMRLGGKAAGYTTEEATKIITNYLLSLSLEVGEPASVKEIKQSISPAAKQTPPQQINFSVQTGLQEFQKLAKPFQPIAEPFIQAFTLDKDKLANRIVGNVNELDNVAPQLVSVSRTSNSISFTFNEPMGARFYTTTSGFGAGNICCTDSWSSNRKTFTQTYSNNFPSGSTITWTTWTINPDPNIPAPGGFRDLSGNPAPTKSGSFVVH
jgi:hypothetical protein